MDRQENYMANSLRLCIDCYKNSCMCGYAYSPLQEDPIEFRDIMELIAKADKLFDERGYPQSYQNKRVFSRKSQSNPISFSLHPEIHRKAEYIVNQRGRLATFDVQVFSRRNTTWQGKICANADGTCMNFRSDLELIHYLDDMMINVGKGNNMIQIRNAKIEEGERLAEIERICFPPAEAASREDVLERIQVFPENFIVAVLDETIVGFINGCNNDEPHLPDEMYHDVKLHKPDGAYQTVFGLNVLPEYRNQGIAGKLVKRYIEIARERGRKGVILTCKDHMVHYYEKFGFVYHGVADSTHGGEKWNDMKLIFDKNAEE